MTDKNSQLIEAIEHFVNTYVEEYQLAYKHLPLIEQDSDWPSPCIQSEFKKGEVDCWRPVQVKEPLSFSNVESALELTLNDEFKTFFTHYYSDTLDASCEHGDLSLLQLWSPEDFERLQENIIGHVLMKQKLKQEVTLFFGLTDQEDYILTINNNSGEVWVERVGKKPHKKLSDSLTEFIQTLSPRIP